MIKTYKRGSDEKLSTNFRASEFYCNGSGCCSSSKIDEKLVDILQNIRNHFGKPVYINSAYRCSTWNKKVGGASGSYHTYGMAADIRVEDTTPAEVAKYAESIGVLGIGLYETAADGYFVHVDTRTSKAFWYGQKQQRRDTFGGAVEKPVQNVNVALPILKMGSTGAAVKALQRLLIHNGYSCGGKGADGDFGKGTAAALRRYQSAYGLTVDGVCGLEVWCKILGV